MGLMDWIENQLGMGRMRAEHTRFEQQIQRWHKDMEARVQRLENEVEVKRIGASDVGKRVD